MDSGIIIGALALFTIGGTLALAIVHFGYHLKDPKNMEATKRVAADRESATTRMSSESASSRTLRQRLDEAPSVNDSLSPRQPGLSPVDVLLGVKWREVRRGIGSPPFR